MVRYVEVLVGKIKYPIDFIVHGCSQDLFCPIIFGRCFLHTIGAQIDLLKEKVFITYAGRNYHLISLSSLINTWKNNFMLNIKWRPLLV
jgi:hypothetical protein